MLGPKSENQITDGDGNTQVGHNSGEVNIGISVEQFIEEMRRKDARIDELIAEKDALKDQVSALEREKLQAEIAELKEQQQGLEARLANPEEAYEEHKQRASLIENLLDDIANQQAFGENRIRSALEAFADLEYEEVDALLEESEQRGIMLAANSAYGRGVVAEDAVKWHDAFDHYKRAADLSGDIEHMTAYARMTWRLQRGDDAVTVHEALCDATEALHGRESDEFATRLNNLAGVVQAQGRYAEAEGFYREALAIDAQTIGTSHSDYAIHLNNLAGVVEAQGRYAEAEGLYREALEIGAKTIGTGHPNYAIRLGNLAGVVRAQGRYAEAEGLYREALEIGAQTIGTSHPDYAIHLNNLAGVVQAQGRYAEAEGLFREALEIDAQTIGAAHPSYAIRLNNLAGVLVKLDRAEEARPLFEQALEIFRATLPPEHPNIAVVEEHIANLPAP